VANVAVARRAAVARARTSTVCQAGLPGGADGAWVSCKSDGRERNRQRPS
jgi:hypothetical protein